VSKGYLLDTSALLAYMENEPGDERVKSILKMTNLSINPELVRKDS
jgi:PIN domain nuclease of toxin-antitoxin system